MKTPNYLFETSWEVCNMVGGIYTVLSTKADELKQILGDNYITIGPDVVKESHDSLYFIEDTTLFAEWKEKAASQGIKVRIGRWKLNSRPLAILVDYTSLYPQKTRYWHTFGNNIVLTHFAVNGITSIQFSSDMQQVKL